VSIRFSNKSAAPANGAINIIHINLRLFCASVGQDDGLLPVEEKEDAMN
jgi:hypothetical protein